MRKAAPETRQQINALLHLTETTSDTRRQRVLFLQTLLPTHLPTHYGRLALTPALLDFAELAEVLLPQPMPAFPSAELHLPPAKTLRLTAAQAWVRQPRKAEEVAAFADLANTFYTFHRDTLPCCPNCGTRTHWTPLIGDRRHRNALLHKCPSTACNMAFLSCD